MIADMQAQIATIKARAEQKAEPAPQRATGRRATPRAAAPSSAAAIRRGAGLRTRPTTSSVQLGDASALTNSLQAEIRSCVNSFAEDIVELLNRSTLDAVQRAFGEPANSGGETTDNAPRLDWTPPPNLPRRPKLAAAGDLSFNAYERMAIERALAECAGNVIEAGQRLKLTKSSIYRRIQVLGIRKPSEGGTFEISAHDTVAHSAEPLSLEAYEKAAILSAIDQCAGNVVAAGKLLRAGKSTLYRRMAALGIPRKLRKRPSR